MLASRPLVPRRSSSSASRVHCILRIVGDGGGIDGGHLQCVRQRPDRHARIGQHLADQGDAILRLARRHGLGHAGAIGLQHRLGAHLRADAQLVGLAQEKHAGDAARGRIDIGDAFRRQQGGLELGAVGDGRRGRAFARADARPPSGPGRYGLPRLCSPWSGRPAPPGCRSPGRMSRPPRCAFAPRRRCR